jgi:Putative glutamine amidotransferase
MTSNPLFWLLAAAVVAFAVWSIRRELGAGDRRLAVLRGVSAACVAVVLIQPQFRRTETILEKPAVSVLIDASQSMNDGNRAAMVREWLDSATFRNAREKVDFRYYSFDSDLTESVPGGVSFAGMGSRINGALNEWSKRRGREDSAGVVLLSDGLDTGGDSPASLGLPCWVLEVEAPGGTAASRITTWQVEPPRKPVSGAETSVRIVLQGWGVEGREVPVELWQNDHKLGEKRIRFNRRGDVVEAMLPLKPEKPGTYSYEIRVQDPAADASAKSQPFVVSVRQEGRRVLLLTNHIGFEGKFLRRALVTDRNVRLDSYARWPDGRWAAFGDGGGDTGSALDISPSALSGRAAVVIADVSPSALNPAQWQALSDYADKGGGLIVLGGPNLLGSPQAASALGRVMPVPTPAPHHDGRFGVKLTDAGLRHPVFGPLFESVRDFPALQGANLASGVAGNAQVLMETVADNQARPLVVVKQQGSGRVAVVLSDTLWRWRVASPGWNGRLSAYDTFWAQMLDWISPDQEGLQSTGRIELTTDRPFYHQGGRVTVCAEWIGRGEAPYNTLNAVVRNPGGGSARVEMKSAVWLNPEGRRVVGFRGVAEAGSTGVHEVLVTATWKDGQTDATLQFAVAPSPDERRGEPADAGFLRALASQSGGGYFTPGEGGKWLDVLPRSQRRSDRVVVTDAWNHPLVVILLCGSLCGEWWLRRRRGLA